jgi:uncharacterized cupin superfamily protein
VRPPSSSGYDGGPRPLDPHPWDIVEGRGETRTLSDAGGLTRVGVRQQTLEPGARTSERHWHEGEDEFLYVLGGEVTVVENDGPHRLGSGDVCCWPAGVPNAHTVENRSDAPCSFLVAGSRPEDDVCHYPDSGRRLDTAGDRWRLVDVATGEILKGNWSD